MFKPVARTKTECIEDICGAVTVTDGGSETCTDDPHHGPGEKYEEAGGDEYKDESKKHHDMKGKKIIRMMTKTRMRMDKTITKL